jgi:hypothetical protein
MPVDRHIRVDLWRDGDAMSTDRELILEAIADTPLSSREIAEATGLEGKTVYNRLAALRHSAEVQSEGGKYSPADGKIAPKSTVHHYDIPVIAAPRLVADAPPKRAVAPPAAPINGVTREMEFAISESGAILFKITHGPSAGELGEINHMDAMALFRLMAAVDFIADNA